MDPAKRAFYQFHASLMEPWDGPASVAFTDGTVIGAVLDRNGLRPSRYWVTSDGLVVMASEVGVLDIDPSTVVQQGPAPAGPHVPGRHHAGPHRRRRRDQVRAGRRAALRGVAPRRPRPPRRRCPTGRTPATRTSRRRPPAADLRLHDRGAQAPHRADGPHRRARASARWAPTRRSRCCRPARGCCSTTSPSCSPRSPTRRSTPSARSWSPASAARSAPRATCSTPAPASCRQIVLPRPILDNDELAKLVHVNDDGDLPGLQAVGGPGPVPGGRRRRRACARRSTGCAREVVRGHRRRRADHRAVRPRLRRDAARRSRRCCSPPRCTTTSSARDPHAGRPGDRDRRRPRGAPHGAAARVRRRRHQPVPGLRDDRGHDRPRPARRRRPRRRRRPTTSRPPARACSR